MIIHYFIIQNQKGQYLAGDGEYRYGKRPWTWYLPEALLMKTIEEVKSFHYNLKYENKDKDFTIKNISVTYTPGQIVGGFDIKHWWETK